MSQVSMSCGAASSIEGQDGPGAIATTPAVAMLAATALGFAINAGSTDDNVRRLRALADFEADLLVQAGAVVLQRCASPDEDRIVAVELLGRAARCCSNRRSSPDRSR